jgi:LacI family transcriptional regulator
MKRVSLKDIAKLVGVSPSTVSFVLNGKAKQMRISTALADRITEVAKSEGYHPNQVAVSLRTGKSQMLGLIVESISGNFFASLARTIEEQAEHFGYKVVYCSTENDVKKGRELIKMLAQRQVDGYIITPTPGMEQDIQELVTHKRPLVLLDSYFPEIEAPYVLVNNFDGVTKGMNHLVKKGFKHIGYVTVDLGLIQVEQRLSAYLESLKANNIPYDENLVLTVHYKSNPEESIKQISNFIKTNTGLQAIFFATNYLGLLGLESIHQLGLSLPKDLAMMSFDDHDVFRLFPPGITCIQQPVEEIAKTAVQLLMNQLGKSTEINNSKVEIPGKLMVRGTTG